MLASRCLILALAMLLAPAALAQDYRPPLTVDGKPDLQGHWTAAWLTPLERPPEASKLKLTPAEAAALWKTLWSQRDARDPLGPLESVDVRSLVLVNGEARSSLIVDPTDGRLPLTDAARARPAPRPPTFEQMDDPEQRPPSERCAISTNMIAPLLVMPAGNIRQIVQTPTHLAIYLESFLAMRIIPLNAQVPGDPLAGRGRWEGDTLVVETTTFGPNDRIRVGPYLRFPVSEQTRIVERFRRTGPDEILYAFTVEDPKLYRTPWTAEMSLIRSDQQAYEWACHEGNYALSNMLRGARIKERRLASKEKP